MSIRFEKIKHMTKRLLVLALCAAGLLAVLMVLSLLVTPKWNDAFPDETQQSAHAIVAEPESSLDVIVVGDSGPKSALSPLHMYEQEGFTSFICGTFSQRPHIAYSTLKLALDRQQPKVLLIETNVFYCEKYTFSNCVMQLIEDALPIFQFHDRWKHLTWDDFDFDLDRWHEDSAKGYYVNTTVKPANGDHWMEETDEVKAPSLIAEFYLRLMVSYCREKGVTPVLLSVPSTLNMNDAKHNALQKLADDMGVDYIDLNEGDTRVDVQWETESRDGGDHLNYTGAVRASRDVASLLVERYGLPDHRGDSAYQDWDQQYEAFVAQYPVPETAEDEETS